jgi:hypothetical protein
VSDVKSYGWRAILAVTLLTLLVVASPAVANESTNSVTSQNVGIKTTLHLWYNRGSCTFQGTSYTKYKITGYYVEFHRPYTNRNVDLVHSGAIENGPDCSGDVTIKTYNHTFDGPFFSSGSLGSCCWTASNFPSWPYIINQDLGNVGAWAHSHNFISTPPGGTDTSCVKIRLTGFTDCHA